MSRIILAASVIAVLIGQAEAVGSGPQKPDSTATNTSTDTKVKRPPTADPDKSILTNKNIHGDKVIDPVTLDPK